MTGFVVPLGGVRLDRLAKLLLRTELSGAVEALLEANPGLSAIAADGFAPAGTTVITPSNFNPAPSADFVLPWE